MHEMTVFNLHVLAFIGIDTPTYTIFQGMHIIYSLPCNTSDRSVCFNCYFVTFAGKSEETKDHQDIRFVHCSKCLLFMGIPITCHVICRLKLCQAMELM